MVYPYPSSIDALISNAFDNHLKSYDAGFENYNITVNVDNDNNCITIKSSGKGITAIRHPDDNVPVAIQAELGNYWSRHFFMCTHGGKYCAEASLNTKCGISAATSPLPLGEEVHILRRGGLSSPQLLWAVTPVHRCDQGEARFLSF